jgi:nucleotidyltransferase substrate binding protein (TIGR01987 family)
MTNKLNILNSHLLSWEKALKTFSDVMRMPETEIVRDAAIQRFEYNFELGWKAIKRFAEKQGLKCNSPREAVKIAFKLGLMQNEDIWLDMIDDRNRTTHTYKQEIAEEIYANLKKYESEMKILFERMSEGR